MFSVARRDTGEQVLPFLDQREVSEHSASDLLALKSEVVEARAHAASIQNAFPTSSKFIVHVSGSR
jgi:hypothetical protein